MKRKGNVQSDLPLLVRMKILWVEVERVQEWIPGVVVFLAVLEYYNHPKRCSPDNIPSMP